jgi:hypothetical protein
MELPWRNNERNISCIPTGKYKMVLHKSSRFGNCFWVQNVPGRDEILIHHGNTERDTEGCILVGIRFGSILGENAVLNSREAMNLLYGKLKLTIEEMFLEVL